MRRASGGLDMGESAVSQLTKELLDLFGGGAEFGGDVHGADHQQFGLVVSLENEAEPNGGHEARGDVGAHQLLLDEGCGPAPLLEREACFSWLALVNVIVVLPEQLSERGKTGEVIIAER